MTRDHRSYLRAIEETNGVVWGAILLGLAAILLVVAILAMEFEQARSPGEENLGVPFIGLIFGFPVLISALLGLGFFIETAIWRMRAKKLPE